MGATIAVKEERASPSSSRSTTERPDQEFMHSNQSIVEDSSKEAAWYRMCQSEHYHGWVAENPLEQFVWIVSYGPSREQHLAFDLTAKDEAIEFTASKPEAVMQSIDHQE